LQIANGYFKTDMKMTFYVQKLIHSSISLTKDITSHSKPSLTQASNHNVYSNNITAIHNCCVSFGI